MNKYLVIIASMALVACSDGGSSDRNNDPVEETAAWQNQALVETVAGPVEASATANAAWAWKAIPYAAPPVGELRWQAPQAPEPWSEPIASEEFGSQCVQFGGAGLVGSEDCLFLNVWRPQSEETNLPVYVWIHGGGNSSGSAGEPHYAGANLAVRSNVVYVSMNYRLGPLGWLYDPALRRDDADTDSGNFGTLDIIASLQWIQDNIEQFGGDPDNVIITGESAGGINVLSMLISPRANGLFSQAMSQSGLLADITLTEAQQFAAEVKAKIAIAEGLASDEADARLLLGSMHTDDQRRMLLDASLENIMEAIPTIGVGLLSMPFIFPDGEVIHREGPDSLRSGNYPNKVPVILGTNSGDVRLFLFVLADPAMSLDTELYNSAADIGGMFWKAAGADELAALMSTHSDQPDIYVYSFEWGRYGSEVTAQPMNYLIGAAHSIEIPFFLDTLDETNILGSLVFSDANRASRGLLSDAMIAYLQNFIRTDDPNGDDALPTWRPWSNAEGADKYIVFDADLDELQVRTRNEAVTRDTAFAALDAIEDEELRLRVDSFLREFTLSCALIAENPATECE